MPGKKQQKQKKPTRSPNKKREPWTPWGKWAKARQERIARRKREREERRTQRRNARNFRRMRRRRFTMRGVVFLGLLVFVCAVGGIVLLLLGQPYPWQSVQDTASVLSLSDKLNKNRARWESLAVNHYTIEASYTAEDVRCGPVTIEVQDGRIVNAPEGNEGHWYPAETCDDLLEHLAVDGAFGWLELAIDDYHPGSTRLTMQFDPEFGYPTLGQSTVYREPFPGCCWKATWADLRPLE